MMKIEIKEIQHGSAEYDLEVALRDKILRKPLGLQFTEEELAKESGEIHIGAFNGSKLVGCLALRPMAKSTIKMRQVAVDESAQGMGIGRKLVAACEAKARDLGFTTIELSARDTAIPFYLKLNYEAVGDPFTEVTIPHQKMRKSL